MYHRPRMCRTCLQMSRGDFKFVSLDAGDPLWESNSPNLKEQLLTLVPEMKLELSGTVMCTSCFIALRTGYEFKKMCQFTEQRFQNYNYKYRRPFGVGPGSAQFHVTLNETRQPNNNKNGYSGCQNINFLQADTSIDITEHHLYDASKPPPRKDFLKDPIIDQVIKTPIESLPPAKVEDKSAEVKPSDIKPIEAKPIIKSKPIEVKPLIQEKPVEVKPAPQIKSMDAIKEIKVPNIKRQQVARKKITASLHIRKKYKIGSEISILKSENRSVSKVDIIPESKAVNKLDMIIKRACDEIEYLKENYITPKSLSCYSKISKLSTLDNLEELNKEANSYYFDALDTEVSCQHCSTTFNTRYKLNLHEIESHPDKQVWKCTDCNQEFVNEVNLRQHIDDNHATPVIPNVEESKVPLEKIVEERNEIKTPDVEMEESEKELSDPLIEAPSEVVEDLNEKLPENKESNIELEKDALLVVSKVVEDNANLDESKKCRPSYEDDDEDFILEDNAFNISDSEDESIDIEINESEINQLLQDDYEGKVIKNITNKANELSNKKKEEKELSKSPFVMILPKNSAVENQKVKILSNSVIRVEELLSKKQIEEKVNKLAEIQFVVLPSKQANTSTIKEKLLMNKELSITNLNLESKIQKEDIQKDSQKPQLDISISENVRRELSKMTVISLVKEDKTTKEVCKKANDKIQKELPKPATSTLTKVEREVSKKHADAQIITSKLKESPKTRGNVQTEKIKVQKESPKKQDKTKTTPDKGSKLKESAEVKTEVQKELTKKQGKSTPERGNKVKETSEIKTNIQKEPPKKQEKVNKLKEVAEVKPEVRKESSKTQDRLDKRNKLKESAEMKTEVQQESSKKQEKPVLEREIKPKESDKVQTDVEKHDKATPGNKRNKLKESAAKVQPESSKKQDKPAPAKEIKPKESDKVQTDVEKHNKSTPEKGNKLKESDKVQTDVEKRNKSTPEKGNKLKESDKVQADVERRNKSTHEKGNKLKESDKVQTDVEKHNKSTPEKGNKLKESDKVQTDIEKPSKSTPEKGNKLKESDKVQTDVEKSNKSTPEKGNKLKESDKVQTDIEKHNKSTPETGIKLKESDKVQTDVEKHDKSTPEKVNKLKESGKVQTDVEKHNKSTPEKGNKLKETEIQQESSKKQDKPTPEKETNLKESDKVQTDVEKHDKSTPEKGNKLKESIEVNINIEKEVFKKQKSTPERRNKLRESPKLNAEKSPKNQDKGIEKGNKVNDSSEVQKESSENQETPTTENKSKLEESPKVKKELFKKQDQPTPEKEIKLKEPFNIKVESKPEIQKDSSTRLEGINKLIGEDVSKVNTEKEPSDLEADILAEVINESPKKQNIASTEKVNIQSELLKTEIKTEDIPVIEEKSSQEPDLPPLDKENIGEESSEIEMNTQTEIKQDMPTLENVNQVVSEIPKMHLDPPILQSETDMLLSQVQLNPENDVDVTMDVELPILETEICTELLDLQLDAPEKTEEKEVVEPKYVKPYWYKYINYIKCFICQKLCRNKLQLLQHCKFFHVPKTNPPKIVEEQEKKEEDKVTIEEERIKVYKRNETPFKCNICDKQVLAKEYLAIHMHIHVPYSFLYDNDRIDNYICYICDKSFPKDRFMRLHNLQVHQTRKTVCKTCNRLFKSEFWYSRHKCVVPPPPAAIVEKKVEVATEDDTENNSFICNVCDRRFARLRFLKSHQHRMHPEAYKINYGSAASTSNSCALSDSVTEANDSVSVADIAESVPDINDEAAAVAPPRNIFDVEAKFLKSSESNFKRRSTDRMPTLQCDFCGAMICENVYDSHIYEHNKKRMEKARKSDEKGSPETPKTKPPTRPGTPAIVTEEATTSETTPIPSTSSAEKPLMKCTFCFRLFQRKYHLLNHIKKHHGEPEPEDLETQSTNEESEVTKASDENETSRNESMEMLECCGRQFKLKAHYARHVSTKHPDIFYKSTPSKPSSPVPLVDSLGVISTRRSNSFKPKENDNENVLNEEPVKEKRVIKRKTLDLVETTETVKKAKVVGEGVSTPDSLKRKKTSESEGESARKKKAPLPSTSSSPPPTVDSGEEQEGPLFKYHCTTCSRKFKQYNQLRDHNNVHTGDRPYKCYFCEPVRGFTQTSSLYVHFRRVHVAIVNNVEWEPYSKNGVCLICSGVFERHSDMFQHAKEFYVENGFDCNVCNENFTMSCHYRIHSNNAVEAEVDNDTASNNSGEFSHASKTQTIRCDPCDKTFKERREFKLHKKSLAHVQQVQTLKKLANHKKGDESTTIEGLANSVGDILKRLSGMKKHRCSPCGITFDKRLDLKKHRREMHRRQVRRKKSKDVIADKEVEKPDEQEASSSTDIPFLDENEILRSITARRRPSVLSENSDDKIDNQTDVDEFDDKVDQSSQSSSQEEDDAASLKALYDDSVDADFDAMKLVESLQLPDDVIAEVIAEEASSEILSSQMVSAVEEIAFNVGYPSVSDDFPQDIIESDGVTYTNMRGVPIDSLE